MNKNYLVIGIVTLVVLGGVGLFLVSNNSTSTNMSTTEESMSQDKAMEKDDSKMMAKSGNYIEYSSEVLNNNSDKRRVLFFYANWCPTCRPTDENFTSNSSQIPNDAVLIRVNYNDTDTDEEEKALAKKYNVTYQHTFVLIDENGNEVKKWNGGQIEELIENLN